MKKIIARADSFNIEDYITSPHIEEHYDQENFKINPGIGRGEKTSIDCKDNDVLELTFDDGSVWYCPAKEIDEVFSKQRGSSSDEFVLPSSITYTSNQRDIKSIALKIISKFVAKKVKQYTLDFKRKLGLTLDKNIKKEIGLFLLDKDFKNTGVESIQAESGPTLLFIHGFCSSVNNAFEDLAMDKSKLLWSFMQSYYKQILGFDHHTVSESPISNAIDLLNSLPDGIELDIIAHSRGGLVADLLAKCDERNPVEIAENDFDFLEGEEKILLKELQNLSRQKKIRVNKIVRAGSPIRGTYLLSNRLDQFLSATLSGLGMAFGVGVTPVYQFIKEFLLDVIKSKSDAAIYPGISAMVPNSGFQKMLNSNKSYVPGELYVIEGDTDIGSNILQSLTVILSNIFFRTANDFVVNTNSMRFGQIRSNGAFVHRVEDNYINHFRYFRHKSVHDAINAALLSREKIEDYFMAFSAVQIIEQHKKVHKAVTRSMNYELGDYDLPYKKEEEDKKPDLTDILFNLKSDKDEKQIPEIEVEILHGDLRFGDSLVMVGHFKDDGIVSAELAINNALNHALKKMYLLGNYPAEINDNLVLYQPQNELEGTVVIGMGERIKFSEFKLRKAVYFGILEYAVYMFNHCDEEMDVNPGTITSLCIGSGYGGLNMEAALTSVLFGIHDANIKILELNDFIEENDLWGIEQKKKVSTISKVQFVELYEHKVLEAFYSLKRIKENEFKFNIKLPENIKPVYGRAKQLDQGDKLEWWHNIIMQKEKENEKDEKKSNNATIKILSSSGRAKVDERKDYYSIKLVGKLLEAISKNKEQYRDISNSLFQLLIPNDLKSIFRNQRNIILKLDQELTSIPWEMIHDKESDKEPTFVNTGLVRQLISQERDSIERITREKSILIIGDPVYEEKYDPLEGAEKEAQLVKELFEGTQEWKVNALINRYFVENTMALLNNRFKILHMAGHGVYNPDTGEAGLVMEDSIVDSAFFRKMPNIPEMAFINCCFSGKTNKKFEELTQNRYKFSASIGMELIKMGVNAVIITGWAVDDEPAYCFAEKIYKLMLDGEFFGQASQKARKYIYAKYPGSHTWGAYQCYGDPWYTIDPRGSGSKDLQKYHTEDEVLVDLFNRKHQIFKKYNKKWIISEVEKIMLRVKGSKFDTANIYEIVAEIYTELDELDLALENYGLMKEKDQALYSVRSLEKINYIQIMQSIENAKEQGRDDSGDFLLNPSYEVIVQRLKDLEKVANTKERFYNMGNACKYLAFARKSKMDEYLGKMRDNYYQAFELVKEKSALIYTYPLMMYLNSMYLVDNEKLESELNINGLDQSIEVILDETQQKTESLPKGKNYFWADISNVNLNTTRLIYCEARENNNISKEKANKEVLNLTEVIISNYSKIFKGSGTLRHIRIEIDNFEHFHFFLESMGFHTKASVKGKIAKAKLKALDKIINELKKLKKNRK